MTKLFLATLIGSAALTTSALAQTQTPGNTGPGAQSPANQQQNDACTQLINELRDMPINQRPVSLRQARQDRAEENIQACRTALRTVRSAQNTGQGSNQNQAETQDRGGQITVRQRQPQVTVQRGRPQIYIEQQRPTVTIEVPPPRVTVRMPAPDINVVGTQGKEQRVSVDRTMQPEVQYESAQPRVVVRQSQQKPQVRFETAQAGDQNRQNMAQQRQQMQQRMQQRMQEQPDQQTSLQPEQDQDQEQPEVATNTQQQPQEQAQTQAGQPIRVATLLEMSLYDQSGQLLGDVERVVRDQGRNQIVIGSGGFLGMGEKQIAVPISQIYRSGDRLIARTISSAEVERMTAWSEGTSSELTEQQTVNVGSGL